MPKFDRAKLKIKARPIENKVFVALREPAKKTPGGIILPESAQDRRAQIADVLEVGPGRWVVHESGKAVRVPMDVQAGDVILCGTYAGAAPNIPELPREVDFRILPEEQILMVLEKYEG